MDQLPRSPLWCECHVQPSGTHCSPLDGRGPQSDISQCPPDKVPSLASSMGTLWPRRFNLLSGHLSALHIIVQPYWTTLSSPKSSILALASDLYTFFFLPENAFPTHSTYLRYWLTIGVIIHDITSSGKPSFTHQYWISAPAPSFIPTRVLTTLHHPWLLTYPLWWKVLWLAHPTLKKKSMWLLVIRYLFVAWMNSTD